MHNIYTLGELTIYVRFAKRDFEQFDQYNPVKLQQMREIFRQSAGIECTFLKIPEDKHLLLIPVSNGQLELVCKVHRHNQRFDTYFSYQALAQERKTSLFRSESQLPEDATTLKKWVRIELCDLDESLDKPSEALKMWIQKVDQLPVFEPVHISQQQQIWQLWVKAQQAIIQNLQKPYSVLPNLRIESLNNDKNNIIRYQLIFKLRQQFLSDYQQLEQELNPHQISERFDAEGCILLTHDDLERVLKPLLERRFKDKIEQKLQISAVAKIKNTLDAAMNQRFKALGWNVKASIDTETQLLILSNGGSTKPITIPRDVLDEFKLVRKGLIGILYKKNETGKTEKEVLHKTLPDNIYGWQLENHKSTCNQDLIETRRAAFEQGYQNVRFELGELYAFNEPQFDSNRFDEAFWNDLNRDFIPYKGELSCNPHTNTISIDFEQKERMAELTLFLTQLDKFRFFISPTHPDFKFKVKTQLIARKSEQEIFLEQLQTLRGIDFVAELSKPDTKKKEWIKLGKLDAKFSNSNQMVLNLPNHFPEDKKVAKETLKILEEYKPNKIKANLIGDEAKLSWLKTAIDKAATPKNTPNGQTVNPRLQDFLFDTSRATPIHDPRKVSKDTEYYWDVKHHELLKLNESQRKAVLAAIHAEDLALLQGPPGTGKTTVIAEIIWQILRKNPTHRILLTSETNLAVDNALDRLLNTKGVHAEMARFTTLIKPLRFGKMTKLDEEGAKYSVDRIKKWLDEKYVPPALDPDALDELDDEPEESVETNSPAHNAVQDWMRRIAERAQHRNPRYAEILKNWTFDLTQPTQEVKELFAEKYFEYANVVGSTCSTSGKPQFMWDVLALNEDVDDLKKLQYQIKNAYIPKDLEIKLKKYNIPNHLLTQYLEYATVYKNEESRLKWEFKNHPETLLESGSFGLQLRAGQTITNEKQVEKLISHQRVLEYGQKEILPYVDLPFKFDTVIMDEASKATPPELLVPLSFGKRCIVIGDHRQLPPMLHDKDFKEALKSAGASELAQELDQQFTQTSQFERMILNPKIHPTLIARCTVQYRMHPHINEVIKQFYLDEGGLTPAPELLQYANFEDLNQPFSRHHGLKWSGFIDPTVHVLWVNVATPEMRDGTSFTNEGEAKIIRKIVDLLQKSEGFDVYQQHWNAIKDPFKQKQEKEIGIISFYGGQKRLLKRHLKGCGVPTKINTVDRFQGMERNIVIVSTVRSHQQRVGETGLTQNGDSGFAKSPQRLNVALSRARRLLIVVGNKPFFEQVRDPQGQFLYKNAIQAIHHYGKIVEADDLNKLIQ